MSKEVQCKSSHKYCREYASIKFYFSTLDYVQHKHSQPGISDLLCKYQFVCIAGVGVLTLSNCSHYGRHMGPLLRHVVRVPRRDPRPPLAHGAHLRATLRRRRRGRTGRRTRPSRSAGRADLESDGLSSTPIGQSFKAPSDICYLL